MSKRGREIHTSCLLLAPSLRHSQPIGSRCVGRGGGGRRKGSLIVEQSCKLGRGRGRIENNDREMIICLFRLGVCNKNGGEGKGSGISDERQIGTGNGETTSNH